MTSLRQRVAHWASLVLLPFFISACSSVPTFENRQQTGDAIVRIDNGASFGAFLGGDVIMFLIEIDGAPTPFKKRGTTYFLRPGKHELTVKLESSVILKEGYQYADVELLADHKYQLVPKKSGKNYLIEFIDETDPKTPALLGTFKAKASTINVLPLPIPVK